MKFIRLILLTIYTLSLVFGGLFIPVRADAYTLTSRESLGLDEKLANQTQQQYAFPEKILITQVKSNAELLDSSPKNWISLLYYYYLTRLRFADIPYNYLVDRQGNVYEGRSGWDTVIPELAETEGAILIGYLSSGSDVPLPASSAMESLVEEVSYKYGIEKKSVEVVDLSINGEIKTDSLTKLKYKKSGSLFANQLSPTLSRAAYSKENHFDFKASVEVLEAGKSAKVGDKVPVKLKLTNDGTNPWFTATNNIYLVTSDRKDSPFAVNTVWDSFDSPLHIGDKTVMPGDSVEVQFDLHALLLPGSYEEEFKFIRFDGKLLGSTNFKVKFKIDKGDLRLIRVLDTETGSLNVRSKPSYSAALIAEVDEGQIFVILDTENGWYKIKYNEEKQGWVFGKYVEEL